MKLTFDSIRRFISLPAAMMVWMACLPVNPAFGRPVGDMSRVGPRTEAVAIGNFARVYYVSASTGSDAKGDGSVERPWASVSGALAAVEDATMDSPVALLVAAGEYRGRTLVCRSFVSLYGGFSPVTWDRDIFEFETILDGQQARRVLVGANGCQVDGFVIRNGRADGPGGGFFCDNTSPLISNNQFLGNHTLSPPNVRADRIHQEGNRGGALAAWYDAAPVVRNNLFSGNWTEFGDGGAVAVYGWSRLEGRPQPLIKDNVFVGNRSGTKDFYRTRSSSGGAIVCSHESDPEIRNNVIAMNRAMGRSDAGGVYVEYYSAPRILGNWIVGNEGDDDGGGIYSMRDGEPLIEGNLIAGNWTTGGGVGGVRLSKEGRMRLIGNIIVRNQSGGGVSLVDGHALVEGNLIAENRGGAGLVYRQTFVHYQPSVIRANHVSGNESGEISIEPHAGLSPIVEGNTEEPVATDIEAPGIEFPIQGAVYDERLHQTEFVVDEALPAAGLVGRAMRVGDRWSVICSSSGNTLRVWGEITGERDDRGGGTLAVLPDYSLER
ncbi:MAG: right-handed parallel beta-helix repeat-containing protein [Opitutaceae bacterium]